VPTDREWDAIRDYADSIALDENDRGCIIRRLCIGFDFQKAMKALGHDCTSPMNSDGIIGHMLLTGRYESFIVEPCWSDIPEPEILRIDFPEKRYEADVYPFYFIDTEVEPYECTYLCTCTQHMLTHNGWLEDDQILIQRVHPLRVGSPWSMRKFIQRLQHDLRSPNV
jgi:hypothetical protein